MGWVGRRPCGQVGPSEPAAASPDPGGSRDTVEEGGTQAGGDAGEVFTLRASWGLQGHGGRPVLPCRTQASPLPSESPAL